MRSSSYLAGFRRHLVVVVWIAASFTGCSPLWESPPTKNGAGVGAAAGAAVGVGIGAIVGAAAGDLVAGAAVGAAAGATVGAVAGNEIQKQENAKGHREDLQQQNLEQDYEQRQIEGLHRNLKDRSGEASESNNGSSSHGSSYYGSPTRNRSGVSNSGGVTYLNPPSKGGSSISSGSSYSSASATGATNRVYLSPPSSYRAGGSETPSSVSTVSSAARSTQIRSTGTASNQYAKNSSETLKPISRIPAPPPLKKAPAQLEALTPVKPTLPSGESEIGKVAAESAKSDLPRANTGSVLPPPAETADDGLPKLDVDDGTVKALEADGAAEGDVVGANVSDELPEQPRARMGDETKAPAHSAKVSLDSLPPPNRGEEAVGQVQPATEEGSATAKSVVSPAVEHELPKPEKEIIKSAHQAELPSKVNDTEPSKVGSPAPPSNDECRQAAAEAQRAKSAVSDADRLFYYRRAVRLCSSEPVYHVEIGKLYVNLGRSEDAKFEFRQAIDLDPSNQAAKDHLGRIEGGGGKS